MSELNDELLGHANDNDGIEEYDNPLPDWWVGMFILCVVWAFGYAGHFFYYGESQVQWYEAEMAEAAIKWPDLNKSVAVSMDPESIQAGQVLYTKNCLPCHGADMKGLVGPNLLDAEWLYGGEPDQVLATVTNGTPKGMPTWSKTINAKKIAQVVAFVLDSNAKALAAKPDSTD